MSHSDTPPDPQMPSAAAAAAPAAAAAAAAAAGPQDPPASPRDTRWELAAELLRGHGIEIGALHLPMRLPEGTSARYVDRMTVADLREHYPELAGLPLTPVDIVDDGELLTSVPPESVDFIVANHFMEHCEDPIRTIGTHLGKIRPGGILFYAIPDKRYTFDWQRETTPLEHIVADHEHGAERSRSEHYRQWVGLVDGTGVDPHNPDGVNARAAELEAEGYSIHFHVWTQTELLTLFLHCRDHYGTFEIEAFRPHSIENIIVLRKHEAPVPDSGPPPAASPATVPLPRGPIPLAALRERLDAPSAETHWDVDVSRIPGRALVQPTDAPLTFDLRLDRPAALRAHVRLIPEDWQNGNGTIRTWVAADVDGVQRELWSGTLMTAEDHQAPDGLAVACEIPADATALRLGAEQARIMGGRSVGRALWIEPRLLDGVDAPQSEPSARVPPGSPARVAPESPARVPPESPARGAPESPVRGAPLTSLLRDRPLISVIVPVHDPPLPMLEEMIASVREQTFGGWELCLVDDGSSRTEILATLQRHAAQDARIRFVRREQAGGISGATNAGLALATGEYIALLDHDDTLEPDALAQIATAIDRDPAIDMIYTDEAIVADGRVIARHHKPAWSPDHMAALMYTCHLGVYRRRLAQEIGGFHSEFDGAQDYDFVLRFSERTDRITHLPLIAYNWRAHAGSTALQGGDAKPYAYVTQHRVLRAHLERTGVDADVQFGGQPGFNRIIHRVDRSVSAALVVCVADSGCIPDAVDSWIHQPHPNWELVVAAPADQRAACLTALDLRGMPRSRTTFVGTDPGDPARGLDQAARAASADHLLLMQTPLHGLTVDWLQHLIGHSAQPGIGAAGPLVLSADGRILEAGIALPDGIPLHLTYGLDANAGSSVVWNLTAVSGALMTPRTTFTELGGLRPEWGELSLIDYCLRATDAGLRIVSVPDARVSAASQAFVINDLPAIWRLQDRWRRSGATERYISPHTRPDRGDHRPVASRGVVQ